MSLKPDRQQARLRRPRIKPSSLAATAFKSPTLIIFAITLTVFTAEALIMVLLAVYRPRESLIQESLADAALLVLLIAPVLYFFLFRPMVAHIREHVQFEHELEGAKATADRANNAKSRFLAAASHDLRQPLSALKLYTGVLKEKVDPDDQALLVEMDECVASLSDLLSKLLDLSKLDAGAVVPQISDFNVDELFEKVHASYAPDAALKGLNLRCGPCGLTARTDPVLFQRIVGNLVSNAIEYSERGCVLVACRRHQGKRWVEVWDSGIGIPQDKLEEVFEEFKQLGNSARGQGSGLGLTIVARTADLLGLQVRVRSRVARGSMFAVELPLGDKAAVAPAGRGHPVVPGVHVAVVDDNPVVLKALVRSLESAGHRVTGAATGSDLLARLEARPPDVVMCDYRLAGAETGFDVIASARRKFGERLPAVIITGDTDPDLMRGMVEKGIVIQHKPVQLEDLQARIQEAIKKCPAADSATPAQPHAFVAGTQNA